MSTMNADEYGVHTANFPLYMEEISRGFNVALVGRSGSGFGLFVKKLIPILNKQVTIVTTSSPASYRLFTLYNIRAPTFTETFGLPTVIAEIKADEDYMANFSTLLTFLKKKIKALGCEPAWFSTEILIIKDVHNISAQHFTLMDSLFKFYKGNEYPFGNMQVLWCILSVYV